MALSLKDTFGTVKPVIAMVHFPGLPGRPQHDRAAGRARLLDVVARDLAALQDAGVDGLLFCNEADLPYQLAVGPEIPAAMAAVIGELRPAVRVPFGVNILWDARASLALARATGAVFIREVLTGVYESALHGDTASIDAMLSIIRLRCRLHGLFPDSKGGGINVNIGANPSAPNAEDTGIQVTFVQATKWADAKLIEDKPGPVLDLPVVNGNGKG